MPFSHWISWTTGILFVACSASAYVGAKLAIRLCAKQNGCAMRIAKEKKQTTQDLREQLEALEKARPDLKQRREAMEKLADTDPNLPSIPEQKP